ncbi:MAG: T9SS type A sorting domain-containing protein [Flavobacteriales bacterium]|nr:T9SS type A sorting domain-containing protein [Flavobacteriales bacterium]
MKKRLTFIIIAGAICIAGIAPELKSNGAPISSTGAPSEGSCGTIGCHDDAAANSGLAASSLDFNNGVAEYMPGETYSITVRIEETDVQRFGYQLLALKNSDDSNCGTFEIIDSMRTQIMGNDVDVQLMDRKYATYRYPGTSPVSSGVGEWTVNWTAPHSDVGPITLYYATLSGDNDGSDLGDEYYLNALEINPSSASGVERLENESEAISVYPNPTSGQIDIRSNQNEIKSIEVYDLSGKLMKTYGNTKSQETIINIGELSDGNYILNINQETSSFSKQITLKK